MEEISCRNHKPRGLFLSKVVILFDITLYLLIFLANASYIVFLPNFAFPVFILFGILSLIYLFSGRYEWAILVYIVFRILFDLVLLLLGLQMIFQSYGERMIIGIGIGIVVLTFLHVTLIKFLFKTLKDKLLQREPAAERPFEQPLVIIYSAAPSPTPAGIPVPFA
eukprot:TRINITY_DN271_c0_g1_i1.p1 TRINITY_DN271_c0_g1~~TRINITY_DN271_c0_g1_i1.p1  ORF type:complete len:166 (-),score=36.03 TRINITY_DN271_c0_g1_i1:102-599(-)